MVRFKQSWISSLHPTYRLEVRDRTRSLYAADLLGVRSLRYIKGINLWGYYGFNSVMVPPSQTLCLCSRSKIFSPSIRIGEFQPS
jgi:hypothetical protein